MTEPPAASEARPASDEAELAAIPVSYETPVDHYREMARRFAESRDELKHEVRALKAQLQAAGETRPALLALVVSVRTILGEVIDELDGHGEIADYLRTALERCDDLAALLSQAHAQPPSLAAVARTAPSSHEPTPRVLKASVND